MYRKRHAQKLQGIVFVWQLNKGLELGFGASYKNISLNYNVWDDPDTLILYDISSGDRIAALDTFPEWRIDEDISSYKTAAYFSLSWDIILRIIHLNPFHHDWAFPGR